MLEEMVEKLEDLAEKVERYQWGEGDEQKAIKYALVLPFLRILGYDVFNPEDVEPGYAPSDSNGKEVGKVDYGLCPDSGVEVILHVTDQALWNSSRPTENLSVCYHASDAEVAILTNGLRYQVYTDLDERGKLDSSPYLVFDLQKIAAGFYQEWTLREVHRLSKWHFNKEKIRERAQTLKTFQQSWWFMKRQLDNPSRSFIKFIQQQIGLAPRNDVEEERFDKIVKNVLRRFDAEGSGRSSCSLRQDRTLSNGADSPPEPENTRSETPASIDRENEVSECRDHQDFDPEFSSESADSDSDTSKQSKTQKKQAETPSEDKSSDPSTPAPDRAREQQKTVKHPDSSVGQYESGSTDPNAPRETEDEQLQSAQINTGEQTEQPSSKDESVSSGKTASDRIEQSSESEPEKQMDQEEANNRDRQSAEADEQRKAEDERIEKARNHAGTEYLSAERIKKQRELANADLNFNGNEQEEPVEERKEKEKVKTVDGQGKNPMDTGFQIFQDIVSEASNYNQISIQENEGVLEMLVQDDPDKCVARLHFNDDSKVLGLFDAYHEEYQIPIKSLDDIYQFEDQIRIAAEEF